MKNKGFTLISKAFRENPRGFTLIELLVAISIVGVLAGLGTIAYSKAQSSARDTKRKSDLNDVKKALYSYRTDNGIFCIKGGCDSPGTDYYDKFQSHGNDSAGWTSDAIFCCGIKSLKQALLDQRYMKAAVFDPLYPDGNQSNRSYFYQINNDTFVLSAYLETAPSSNVGCTPHTGRNYCITE